MTSYWWFEIVITLLKSLLLMPRSSDVGIEEVKKCLSTSKSATRPDIPVVHFYVQHGFEFELWDLTRLYFVYDVPEVICSLVIFRCSFRIFHLIERLDYWGCEYVISYRFCTHQPPLLLRFCSVDTFCSSLFLPSWTLEHGHFLVPCLWRSSPVDRDSSSYVFVLFSLRPWNYAGHSLPGGSTCHNLPYVSSCPFPAWL